MKTTIVVAFIVATVNLQSAADEPLKPIPRRVPPAGIELPAETKAELRREVTVLQEQLAVTDEPLLPDVEIYIKAVDYALRHDEFYDQKDVAKAQAALKTARERLTQLTAGESPWCASRGLVVRGYRSSIDGSPQPYGLEIPAELDLEKVPILDNGVPLYVWLHGRGDKTTDLHFIAERKSRPGKIAPTGAIVLHPFGRHCIGFKSAGEVDVLEAVDHVVSQYPIDRDRIVLMGFSMGGAGAWHIGAHYPDRWVAMSPGAGFAETARYTGLKKADYPPTYEQTLWGVYDVPAYTRNLFNLPVVAYSGENDKQIQAARVMEEAFREHGRELTHIIGPGMGHAYHPDSLADIMRRMDAAVRSGRDRNPKTVAVQTRTLRYNRAHWVEALRLGKHWKDARVDAQVTGDDDVTVTTHNVAALRLHDWQYEEGATIRIDGQDLRVPGVAPMTPPFLLVKRAGKWVWDRDDSPDSTTRDALVKRHGMQGPIDDAFMAPFLVVTPSGKSRNADVQKWVDFELKHFEDRWQALYRGELRKKKDTDVTREDMRKYHLILWGDGDSNAMIKQLVDKLPIQWNDESLEVAGKSYDAKTHVPLLIYPNPLNPRRYLVLNSGPTHREGHDRTNSLQNPKLPDWAVIDITQPPDEFTPGRVIAADFFGETWQFREGNSDNQ